MIGSNENFVMNGLYKIIGHIKHVQIPFNYLLVQTASQVFANQLHTNFFQT